MIARDFVTPKFVKSDEGASQQYARFLVEPFERGYGTTVGNSLRRVLLASLEGSAVTAIRIEGIHHEFSSIPGVMEDATDVVLNFKRCQLRLNREEPIIFSFKHKGAGAVTAGDVFKEHDVDVFNPDLVVFTSTSDSTLIEMEIKVARGRGYVTAENFELEHAPLGTIYLDANFSPVTRVNFLVEDARVGQRTDYDRLILEVWTNGSITPQKALEEASNLLIEHLKIFVQQPEDVQQDAAGGSVDDPELARKLSRPVEELELSVRAANCLKAAGIKTIGDLVKRSEPEMLRFHNFGKKSLDEIRSILETMDLHLGMGSSDDAAVAEEVEETSETT
ncbi:MAG TPA: DNA-directed RNA polymerase subunit alpha [Candidatus Hydrogenedentes bacterium]|jgi:DNA-directed RNA polymerase subunit alpha|nr:DNA-directed RNA polymerase subunit alpha [Candidatus Hydrogenedentota bacterium]MDY0033972.1 DNA-directed RNA polymerase subunit alpha [FCB group bacterium]NLT59956.1 DNA-directed RNA polymerase subunit alpha [Candidatus Hydrogenedentota bacterium]HNV21718.1 DNA-directed RNA polymerase subunit alpha [Candidatus Hydrogenedentota bacterium]HNZ19959.1 DNA-directed RNA polymerase subunit alpha [Candidatus Hydrogenedentota bacterium]